MYARADGLLSTKKKKKKSNSFRVVPAHQLSSCDVGGGPGVGGEGAHGGTQVPFSLPGPKMTNSINSRHLSGAPMESNTPDKRLKGFFLVALTPHLRARYQYLKRPRNIFPSH